MKSDAYVLQPGGDTELFYSRSSREAQCICHIRGDFGRDGKEYWATLFPHEAVDLNTLEFKQELRELMSVLRTNILKNLSSMRKYLNSYPAPLTEDTTCTVHGYHIQTARYVYYLRCSPATGDYHFYLYCYAMGRQADKMKREWKIPLTWSMSGTLKVMAETKEEAIEVALGSNYPLPDNGVYVDDSIMVDGEVEMTEWNEDDEP